jgi:NADPH-dependent curcumin reductase CurA
MVFRTINRKGANRTTNFLFWRSRLVFAECFYPNIPPKTQRKFTTSTRFNMKEAIVAKGPKVTIHDVPIPRPRPSQVLIKVVYSGSNPKDWKRPQFGEPHNSGDDIAGIVEAIGDGVLEFKKGDRVAAFHEMMAPHGSFAEYAIAWDYTTFHLPAKTSFEEVMFGSNRTSG